MAAAGGSSKHTAAASELPTDATAIRNILKTMGVETHEPRVLNMLLDFMYSYVSGVLSDASAFAEQVGMMWHWVVLCQPLPVPGFQVFLPLHVPAGGNEQPGLPFC
jgi:hypothetical protein